MIKLLREYVRAHLTELKWNQEFIDLLKGKYQEEIAGGTKDDVLNVLHEWLYDNGLITRKGNDMVLSTDVEGAIFFEEYEAMKTYALERFKGLVRQYKRRSKDPVKSALSALVFWIGNYYNANIASGKVRRQRGLVKRASAAKLANKENNSENSNEDITSVDF